MTNNFVGSRRILAYSEPVDMRKSFDGLLAIASRVLDTDPLSPTAFVFSNRSRKLIKILFWDRTGFCIYAKRLEQGRFRFHGGEITLQALDLILDGIPVRARQNRLDALNTSS